MQKQKTTGTPYLAARQEWNERYGTEIANQRFSRNLSYISIFTTLIAIAALIYLAAQKEVKPYIVEIDGTGLIQNVRSVGTIDSRTKSKIIKAQLTDFVEKYRNVVLDAQMQRKNIMDVYRYLQRNTPAYTKITENFQKNDPFTRAKKETVFAEITRVMPLKDNAWQIEWREKVMERKTGQTLNTNKYKAITYITISPPADEAAIIKNPLGIIISDINWSKEI